MVPYLTITLEFSEDDLTVAPGFATWTHTEDNLLEATWRSGVQREGDEPAPGQAVFVFDDRLRNYEPDYAAGFFYPNILPERRFRLTVADGTTTASEGIWYASEWRPAWPDRLMNQETTVTCSDGFLPLALYDVPGLDPPDAQSYADVVAFDQPWGYWRLGDPEGTRAVAQFRISRRTVGKGKRRRQVKVRQRAGTRYLTAAEAGGVSGPAGVYTGLPQLGQLGAIVGDPDTSVLFGDGQEVQISVDGDASLSARNAVSAEAWVNATAWPGQLAIMHGPAAGANPMFVIWNEGPGQDGLAFRVNLGSGLVGGATGSATATGEWLHVVGTFDGQHVRLYVNGVETVVTSASGQLAAISSPQTMTLMEETGGGGSVYADEFAVYEHALTPERVLAHFNAGRNSGFPQQTAGERIRAVLEDVSLWNVLSVQVTGRELQPVMKAGQPRLEEVAESKHAEGPRTLFYFNRGGHPTYLGHEWQAAGSNNTVQATFGNNTGEVPYADIELAYDDEFYRTIVASREGGELVQVSEGTGPDRVNSEFTDVLLTNDTEVESLAYQVLDYYKTPSFRPVALHLDGDHPTARTQILTQDIGDLIRVKHRPRGGTAIDRVCHIIGWEKRLERETGKLTATWYLSRGFNAAAGVWRAGIVGFSEAGSTTIAA